MVQWPKQTQIPTNLHRTQWESVLVSVSVQYKHLHTILYNPFFIGLCIRLGVGQCEYTISVMLMIKPCSDCSHKLKHICEFCHWQLTKNPITWTVMSKMRSLPGFLRSELVPVLLLCPVGWKSPSPTYKSLCWTLDRWKGHRNSWLRLKSIYSHFEELALRIQKCTLSRIS